MKFPGSRFLALLKAGDKGTVAVTFLLSFPIFLAIVGLLVQYALLVNARMGMDRAAMAAGRAAMTSLPTDPDIDDMEGDVNVMRAATMALEPLSPRSQEGDSPDAQDVVAGLQNAGLTVPETYATRYTYAQAATDVQCVAMVNRLRGWFGFEKVSFGQQIKLTVNYKFYLTVPGIRSLPGFGQVDTVSGINGRFLTLTSSYIVQLTHGREAGVSNAQ